MQIQRKLLVESSTIATLGYDPTEKVLEIEFKTGAIYQYQNVTATLYCDLLNAESVGKYFSEMIRKNPKEFPYIKVNHENT